MRTKPTAFRVLALILGLLAGLVVAEWALEWRQRSLAQSDRLDPGFIRHDPTLGWRLTPGWQGRHRHHDFDVRYAINNSGFRSAPDVSRPARGRTIAVVGDSFTFGLGVNDDATFVHLLNQAGPDTFLNLSVPGYSTDQEALLIENDVLSLAPDRVLLVVYLANDPLDNLLARPLQLSAGKPRFVMTPAGLELENVPVPMTPPAPNAATGGLAAAVLGEDALRRDLRLRLELRSELFRLVSQNLVPARDYTARIDQQLTPAVRLFQRIAGRIRLACGQHRIELTLALLPGRSFVEQPGALSAQYQEFLRGALVAACGDAGIPVWDLALSLRQEHRRVGGAWFHPNEGHLTPAGHRAVFELIRAHLSPKRTEDGGTRLLRPA